MNTGKYQIRLSPEYKDKLAVIEGFRKTEGATEASKYSVAEEAIDFYYELIHVRNGKKLPAYHFITESNKSTI